jgi:hypothetical protein
MDIGAYEKQSHPYLHIHTYAFSFSGRLILAFGYWILQRGRGDRSD